MSREIAKALGVQPSAVESERMARPPTANLEAYDYYLRAEQAARTGRRDGLRKALALYDKAEELDPAFAEAFAADARTTVYIWRASFNDIIQSAPARKRAYEKASRALELDPDLSSPYAILGIMQVVDRRYEEAIASAKRAVALGPGDAETQIALGYVQLFAGNHAEAARCRRDGAEARSQSFRHQSGNRWSGLSPSRQHREGDRELSNAPATMRRQSAIFRITLAAAYARAGRLPDARAAIAEGLRLRCSTARGPIHWLRGGSLCHIFATPRIWL